MSSYQNIFSRRCYLDDGSKDIYHHYRLLVYFYIAVPSFRGLYFSQAQILKRSKFHQHFQIWCSELACSRFCNHFEWRALVHQKKIQSRRRLSILSRSDARMLMDPSSMIETLNGTAKVATPSCLSVVSVKIPSRESISILLPLQGF